MVGKNEIAIVGVGCRFPGADNLREYWKILKNGENHIIEVPRHRWNIDAFYDPDRNAPGKTYVQKAGFISSIDEWDNRFFGINDMEAELVDPQQRIVLDCVHMALEDGGITRKDIWGTQTGVYIGSMTDDYKGHVMDDTTKSSTYSVTGTQNSIISARVSYTYNLSGPSMTLDTACSSSLVAIDVASQALVTGKCSMAICGGVNILMDPQLFIALSKAGMLSPDGQCKTFTKDADGYARGEGCGIVLLKTLKDAVQDGNKIWATIKTGTNQDGHMTQPITAPSGLQQEKLIEHIYRSNGVDKASVNVIEAHGTGTSIGDPTEANALGAHFGKKSGASDAVFIGSVKTNIGHLEAAAGVAGLIKVLLMMKNDMIVPSLWYSKDNENPKVKLSEHGFVVPTKCIDWKSSGSQKRLACVNSFGFGGTNAHCIVEEYVPLEIDSLSVTEFNLPFIITTSSLHNDSLFANVKHMHDILKLQNYDMRAVSYTSTCKRDHRPQRKAFFGNTQDDIIASSSAFLSMKEDRLPPLDTKKIVFVFCGVGTAWKGMCSLLMKVDAFKEAVVQIDKYLKPLAGWEISNQFIECVDILSDPFVAHIAIFACQVGIAAFWKVLGIVPEVVIGQSVGEVAAAYVAGIVDLQTAVKIIFYRSKVLATVKKGTMAVIPNVDVDLVEKCCKGSGKVTIAVYNSPKSCTVSGMGEDIQTLKQKISSTYGVEAKMIYLRVKCAYHSQHVEEAAKEIGKHLKEIKYCQGHTPMISTVTGKTEGNSVFGSSNYWEKNVVMPVLFSNAIQSVALKSVHKVFVELGPSPVLHAHLGYILNEDKNYTSIPSMQKQHEANSFAEALCSLYDLGMDINWTHLFPQNCILTDIPTYQFRKFRNLYRSPNSLKKIQGVDSTNFEHLYIKQLPQKDEGFHFEAEISENTTPFVFQHMVSGNIILPGAAYAEVGFEIGSNVLMFSKQNTVVSLEFLRPVRLETGFKTILHISTVHQGEELLFHAKQNQITMCKGWVRSTTGLQSDFIDKVDIDSLKLSILNDRCKHLSKKKMYANLESMGFSYGSCFKLMNTCLTNGVESLTEIIVPDNILTEAESTTIHPCILDGMLQSTINTTTGHILMKIKNEKLSFLPVALGELRVPGNSEKKMFVFTKRINTTFLDTVLQVHYNILLLNEFGIVVADLRNYTTYGKRNASLAPCELSYRLTWQPLDKPKMSVGNAASVLVLTNTPSHDILEFGEFDNVRVCQNTTNKALEDFVDDAFRRGSSGEEKPQNIDTVLLLIPMSDNDGDITDMTASALHESVKNNCMLLTYLVKYMTNNSISSPLYVATQNTQPTFTRRSQTINLTGEELWGFVRSINMEFIHGEITLIDLQPSLKETKQTLFLFINDTYLNIKQTQPEIVIYSDKIFGAQFTKVPKKEIIPTLRLEKRIAGEVLKPHKLLALRSKRIQSLILTPSLALAKKPEGILLHIKSVYLHPASIFPRTTSSICLDQDIWEDNLEGGHCLYGIEYTGIQMTKPSQTGIEKNSQKECDILAIYPSEIRTEMSVPKACSVSLREIPFHQPGLILYAVLSWRLCVYVPDRSSVIVIDRKESSMAKVILERLVCTQRNARLVAPSKVLDESDQWVDILITFEKLDLSFPLLGRCKKIICLEDCVSESVRLKVSRSAKQSIECFSTADLLGEKHVGECLFKVINWLQENYQQDNMICTSLKCFSSVPSTSADVDCNLPDTTIYVMKNDRIALPIQNPIDKLFSKSAVYIITGGLTGLGWEFVTLLAKMGAGTIASISRRDVTSERMADIKTLEKNNSCKIICARGDVTDLKSVQKAIKEIESSSSMCPIRGVFHGAGSLNGKLLMNLEESHLDFVLKPKVIGTMNMHIATKEMNLDYFVVPSSINSLIGSPGQSSYGAANSFLDTFIEWRRRKGFAGQAINWGALCVGMASRPEFVDSFTKRGFNLLSIPEIQSCLQEALLRDATSIIYTDINWDICAKDYTNPQLERPRLQLSVLIEQTVSHVMNFDNDGIDNMLFDVKALRNAGKERQLLAITQLILNVSSKVIGGDVSQITVSSTLGELALDSMSSVTFINIIQERTGHRIPPSFILDTSHTLNNIVQLLFDALFTK